MNKNAVTLFSFICLMTIGVCSGREKQNTADIINFPASVGGVVKVMTFNIRVDTVLDAFNRWSNRRNLVVDTLASEVPDVFGIQEGLFYQVRQIQEALPQYSDYSAGRNDGKQNGESCAIFYRKDRFIMDAHGTFWFSDTPDKAGSKGWGNINPRICSWVHLIEKGTNRGFYVYNVHLDNISQKSRTKSIELLAKQVAARRLNDRFILMGDFNMELSNLAMSILLNDSRQSPYPRIFSREQSLNPSLGTRHNFSGSLTGPKIDHILTGEYSVVFELSIDHHSVNGRYPSDHFPVIAKILL